MWVPHKELKKKKQKKMRSNKEADGVENENLHGKKNNILFLILIFFLRFTETCPSEFIGINTESVLRNEGYA